MPVSVLMPNAKPQQQREPTVDPLDRIMKGLSIASSIYGIKDAYDKGQMLKEQNELTKAQQQALKEEKALALQKEEQGILSNEKFADITKDREIVTPNAPNSILFRRKIDGRTEDIWLGPKKKELDPRDRDIKELKRTMMEQGLKEGQVRASEAQEALETPYGVARTKDDAKQLKEAYLEKKNFDNKIDQIIALREKHKGGAILDREDVQRGKQLSNQLLLSYKNMERLGVLSKSDEDIINSIIPEDPLSYNSPIAAMQGQDPILHRLRSFKSDSDKDFATNLETRLRGISSNLPKQIPQSPLAQDNQKSPLPSMDVTSGSQPPADIMQSIQKKISMQGGALPNRQDAAKALINRQGMKSAVGKR